MYRLQFTNVDPNVENGDIQRFFKANGIRAKVVHSSINKKTVSRSIFGIISFRNEEDRELALEKCNHQKVPNSVGTRGVRRIVLDKLDVGQTYVLPSPSKKITCFICCTFQHKLEDCPLSTEEKVAKIYANSLCFATGMPLEEMPLGGKPGKSKQKCGQNGCQLYHLRCLHDVYVAMKNKFTAMTKHSWEDVPLAFALHYGWIKEDKYRQLLNGYSGYSAPSTPAQAEPKSPIVRYEAFIPKRHYGAAPDFQDDDFPPLSFASQHAHGRN